MSRLDSLKRTSRRTVLWSSTPNGLTSLFVAGLVIRLILARGGGFPFDMSTFAAWSGRLGAEGPGRFYADPDYFVDYPPGYLYVLLVLGKLMRLVGGGAPPVFVLKLPGIAADLGLAWLAVRGAERLSPRRGGAASPYRGLAAAAVLLNPAVFFVSATWGQVDALLAVLVLGAFLLLFTGPVTIRREAAGIALLAIALATKPQSAFVMPVAGGLLVWRHVRGGWAEAGRGGAIAGISRIAGLGLLGLGAGLAMMAPFGLGLGGWLRFYSKAASTYPYTSVWAFNFWSLTGFWKRDFSGDEVITFLGVPSLYVGIGLFAVATLVVLAFAVRALERGETEGRVAVFGAVALTALSFALLTRMHERYLFLAIGCLAALVGFRGMRRALALLSVLYFVNVYFAYVYYLDYVKRKSIKFGPVFNALYGKAQDSPQKLLLGVLTGLVCLSIAWRGWRWLRERQPVTEPVVAEPLAPSPADAAEAERPPPPPREPVTLRLHAVGRRGAATAAVVFVLAGITRVFGVGAEPAMYFDEVYHARTAGEYLQQKEVYEWTHPPLAKELIAISMTMFSGFSRTDGAPLPAGMRGGAVASLDSRVLLADAQGGVRRGSFTDGCGIRVTGVAVPTDVKPGLAVLGSEREYVLGAGPSGPAVAMVQAQRQVWRAELPGQPATAAALGPTLFVVTTSGELVRVASDGAVRTVASGAAGIASSPGEAAAWVSFPRERRVSSMPDDGSMQANVQMQGVPGALVLLTESKRVLAADTRGGAVEMIDLESGSRSDEIILETERFVSVAPTGLAWASVGSSLSVIEPRGLSVIGRVRLEQRPATLLSDPAHRRVVAVGPRGLECASGKPQFAWRFASGIFGAALVAFVFLLALRLFGSRLAAWLAAAFVVVDGLAFTLARIAMNDSFVAAFIVAAWFFFLSALYQTGANEDARPRSNRRALLFLALAGLSIGGGVASKWVALYGMVAIGLFVVWDMVARRREGLLGILRNPVVSFLATGVLLAAVPLLIYLASYVPYFRLGHNLADLITLQKGMVDYHTQLTATHPYGSPWYMWPAGRKAVWLFLGNQGADRAEIWTVANPVVLGGGLVGLGVLAWTAVRRRAVALAILPIAALAQYVPWTFVDRVTFFYHYLPEIPFLALGLAWWVGAGRKGISSRQRAVEVGAVLGAAVVVFLFLLPIVDGWFVSASYLEVIKERWLRWMF